MKFAQPALKTFLDTWDSSKPVMMTDLYIFTLITGEVFHYSGFDRQLVAQLPDASADATFILGPRFSRTKTKVQVGPQIDELELDVYVSDADFLGFSGGGDLSWQQAAWEGAFDGCLVEVLRAFFTVFPGTPPIAVISGTLTWFYGRVGDVEIGRTTLKFHIKSMLDLLTVQMPRRLFQAACNVSRVAVSQRSIWWTVCLISHNVASVYTTALTPRCCSRR
jgi:hypothetical protein